MRSMSFQELVHLDEEWRHHSLMHLMHVTLNAHRWRGHWFQLIDMLMPLVIYQLYCNFHVCWLNLTAREYFREEGEEYKHHVVSTRKRHGFVPIVLWPRRSSIYLPRTPIFIYLHLPGHHLWLCDIEASFRNKQLDNWFDSTLENDRWPMINLSIFLSVIYLRWLTFW